MLLKAGAVQTNYANKQIPSAIGIALVPVMLVNFILFLILNQYSHFTFVVFILAITVMTLVGAIDDFLGNKNISGLKGHLKSFWNGKITTGFLKAFIGGLLSCIISMIFSNSIKHFIVNVPLIALCTNFLNLMDLRPGRAIKGFLALSAIYIKTGINEIDQIIFFCIIGFCISCIPYDLQQKGMLGDAGSNSLGVSLGIGAAISFSIGIKCILLLILILVHLLAEKYSLSKIIENNSILNYIDQIGRY